MALCSSIFAKQKANEAKEELVKKENATGPKSSELNSGGVDVDARGLIALTHAGGATVAQPNQGCSPSSTLSRSAPKEVAEQLSESSPTISYWE